jgi:hypothetical protein
MLNSIFGRKKEKSGSDLSASSPSGTPRTRNVSATFKEFDIEYYTNIKEGTSAIEEDRFMSSWFWPPVRNGKFLPSRSAVALKVLGFVSDDADLLQHLKNSEVLKIMGTLGVDAKLCATNDKDASVHVLVDASICSTPSSYEIQIGDGQVTVIGADRAGVVYGMYTMYQHLKTHSERSTEGSATCLTIPATVISDRPAVAQRAVLWSYRHLVRTPAARAQEQIEMLARLRMNALFVAIDEPSPTVSDGEALTALLSAASHSLVDVVPTVVVCSIHQGYVWYLCASTSVSFDQCADFSCCRLL